MQLDKQKILQDKDCFILDFDGTVFLGDTPIAGTVSFIKKYKKEKDFYFLSNNTSKVPSDYISKLNQVGIEVDESHIITPYLSLLIYLSANNISQTYLLGNNKFSELLIQKSSGISFDNNAKDCQAVIVAFDNELTYQKLEQACLLLHNLKIKFIATHCDKVCPTEKGDIPDVGSFLSLIETATGRKPDMVLGKPDPSMIESIMSKYQKEKIVLVGDRLYTDKLLAEKTDIDFILVLSGETKRENVAVDQYYNYAIFEDLSKLL